MQQNEVEITSNSTTIITHDVLRFIFFFSNSISSAAETSPSEFLSAVCEPYISAFKQYKLGFLGRNSFFTRYKSKIIRINGIVKATHYLVLRSQAKNTKPSCQYVFV